MMNTAMPFWSAALLVHRSTIFRMQILRSILPPILLLLPCLTAYGQVIPPSGDTTGKTDAVEINSVLSSTLSAQLACNAHYYTNVTIQVPGGASLVGCGYSSLIQGVGTISGAIVQVAGTAAGSNHIPQLVGNFQIVGGTATNAVNAGGASNTGPFGGVHLLNIWVSGGTYTDVFWFSTFFNSEAGNLLTNGSTGTASCFHFDGQVNANSFNTLLANCGAPYGFYMENDNEPSGSTGNTFNALTAEGGCPGAGTSATCAGLYVGAGFSTATFNGLYSENVLHPIVLGNASAGKVCTALTFNAPVLAGPSAVGANQVALVDIDDCSSVTFVSPFFNINGIAHAAPLTFSGGGCTTEPTAEAIPNPSGVIKAVTLTYPGAGCTSAPTVAVGGSGSGASITATEAGGVVTGLTLSAAGTGYTLPTGAIVPLIVKTATKAGTIIDPMCPDGVNGIGSPCWAWLVGGAGFGVNIEGDSYNIPGSGSYSGISVIASFYAS